jgi:PAS domain S-box-containing protein
MTSGDDGDRERDRRSFSKEDLGCLESVFDAIQDGVSILDTDLTILRANRWMKRRYAHAEPIEGRKCYEVYQGRDAPCAACPTQAALRTGELHRSTLPFPSEEQPEGWLELSAYPLWDRAGNVVGVVESVVDITDRMIAEDALRQSERQFREFFEMAPDAAFIESLDGEVLACNAAATRLLGYDREELVGMNVTELVPSDAIARLNDVVEKVREHGTWLGESQNVAKDGTVVPVEVSTRLIQVQGQEAVLALVRDIRDRIRAEEDRLELQARVQQAQKLESLERLAGGVAHDFNNLLMAILGNAELARQDLPTHSPILENIEAIEAAAHRASDLSKQMLAFSGKGTLKLTEIDLDAMVADMVPLLEVSISKRAMIDYRFGRNLPLMRGDPSQLRQLILNLVTNASEAIGEGSGVIFLSTGVVHCDQAYLEGCDVSTARSEGVYVFLDVSDTGCGMDEETRRRVFDPFFSTKFTGRGLGLAAVLGIVRGHGGGVRIESEIGRGTTIRVLLPALEAEQAPRRATETGYAGEPRSEIAGTVLLVDDEDSVRALGRRMLERLGFEVITAGDGEQAVATFKRRRGEISCVVLDLTMPRMDGETALEEIRRIDERVPVVMSSGYDETKLAERLGHGRSVSFIQKPYRMDDLRRVLLPLLDPDQS